MPLVPTDPSEAFKRAQESDHQEFMSSEDALWSGEWDRLKAELSTTQVEVERLKHLLQKVHEWYWERQAVPYALEELIDEIDDTTPMLVKIMQAADRAG